MSKNINIYICIVFLLIILILLNTKTRKNKIQGGEEDSEIDISSINIDNTDNMDNTDCTLEQIEKHNTEKDKWIYNNGNIYNLSPIIEAELINTDINIDNIIKFLKLSKEQDLSKIFKSIESYNDKMIEFNKVNPDNTLEIFDFGNLDKEQITDDNSKGKEIIRLFNKFKFIFIKSITQFSKGIICPAGLKI